MFVHLTPVSANAKTGPIPVSTTSADTCPPGCPFRNNGCYAGYGPLKLHWDKVSSGERGMPWADFLKAIKRLRKGTLWRHNQAGDLPGVGDTIDGKLLRQLVGANRGRQGFTYTHKPMTAANYSCVKAANEAGFAVNASANTLAEADALLANCPGVPVVAVVSQASPDKGVTPAGNKFIVCPAQARDDIDCASCGLCANTDARRPVIAFRAHGTGKKRIEAILL